MASKESINMPIRKPAFVTGGSLMKARSIAKGMLNDPKVRKKLAEQITASNLNTGNIKNDLVKMSMKLAREQIEAVARGKLMNYLHSDMASLSSTSLTGNKYGECSMITNLQKNFQKMPGEITDIRRFKYSSFLNEKAKGKIWEKPYGFSRQKKRVLNSYRDMNRKDDKMKLVSESGFEQSLVDILCESSCFRVEDLKILTRCSQEVKDWQNKLKKNKAKAISSSGILSKIDDSNVETQKNQRLYSKVTRLDSALTISNDSPAFGVNLKVSLCVCRDMVDIGSKGEIKTADQNYIYENIILDAEDPSKFGIKKRNIFSTDKEILSKDSIDKVVEDSAFKERKLKEFQVFVDEMQELKQFMQEAVEAGNVPAGVGDIDQECSTENKICDRHGKKDVRRFLEERILQFKDEQELRFKRSMTLRPGTRVMNSECCKDNLVALKQYRVTLRPSEIVTIEVKQNLTRGIDLFTLDRRKDLNSPISYFFIVEGIGSFNARVTDSEHPQIKYVGHAPVQLRYEMTRDIQFISRDSEPSYPSTVLMEGVDFNFEDESLAEIFYPKRTANVSFPMSKLRIGERNKKARYTLDFTASSLNDPTSIENTFPEGNYFDLEELNNMTEYLKSETKNLVANMTEADRDLYEDDDDDETINLDDITNDT